MLRGSAALLALASLFGAAAVLAGQRSAAPEVRTSARAYQLPPLRFQAQTDRVEVEAVVRDRDGQPIAGLRQDQFRILDNGQPRPLTDFSVSTAPPPPPTPYSIRTPGSTAARGDRPLASGPATAAPRSIALYFDDVNTEKNDLANARLAAQRFVREALEPGDRVAVFTASSQQSLASTHDAAKLLAAIEQIRAHPRASDSMLSCPRITPYQAFEIVVQHDPMAMQAAVEERATCPGENPEDSLTGKPLASMSMAASRDREEPVLAQAEATWTQAEAIADDTLRAEQGVVAYLATQPGGRMLLMASGGFLGGGALLEQQQENIVAAA
ncbi:MAG: VWA domain-containing protein, partial [Terriglobales bacterium]